MYFYVITSFIYTLTVENNPELINKTKKIITKIEEKKIMGLTYPKVVIRSVTMKFMSVLVFKRIRHVSHFSLFISLSLPPSLSHTQGGSREMYGSVLESVFLG